jgi:hypothetical protein
MGTVTRSLGIPVASSRSRGVRVLLPPPPLESVVMFARARRPGHVRLEAFALLATLVAVIACGTMVVCDVARAHTQVQAAHAEYAAAGLEYDR